MAKDQPVPPSRSAKRDSRSRKGCPECRSRKVKCDEQKPECGQCLKTGRVCRIIDSLFKPHSYSFAATPAKKPFSPHSHCFISLEKGPDQETRESEKVIASPSQDVHPSPPGWTSNVNSRISRERAQCSPRRTERGTASPRATNNRSSMAPLILSPARSQENHYTILPNQGEDSYQDRCEIAFFLRHFSEGPGQWMDLFEGQSYFSRHIVQLAHWSPLVRYAACALGAKQLGQTRHPAAQIQQTNTQKLMLQALIDTKLGFTWYGAKYYERAIQLLAKQISKEDRLSCSLSPNFIYGSGLTPLTGDNNTRVDGEDTSPFLILAACILCQYEDVNATIRAWSGHLDGVYRLLRPHLPEPAIFRISTIPQAARAVDTVFWYFVLNDMLNGFVTRTNTRVNTDDLVLWRKMGLPLDDHGHLLSDFTREAELEIILFKTLLRTMCELVNSDLGDPVQWNKLNDNFDRWQSTVPPSFYIPIAWPPVEPNPAHSIDPFTREIWFSSDICALTIAFYHMSRIVLLATRPMELFMRQNQSNEDLLATYNILQQDLRKHTMEIIPIMHAMPSEAVQKYMLQPLYVAGRSLTDDKERRSLLQILQAMGDDFGLFTDYRIRDLCEEWGMPCDGIDRKDGHGILT